jgi:MFS transporter, DHA3 family, macrolide efflux protein
MHDTSPAVTSSLWRVLSIPSLRRLWIGQLVSVLGDFLAIFAIFSIISFRMHGTPAQVSLVLVAYLLPFTFVSPLAGVFVDRCNLKRTLITSDLIRAGLCILLPFAANVWQIYAILLAMSVVSTFFSAAHAVTIRTIVPRDQLMSANAVMQQAFYMMQILGPALAGILVAWLGQDSCFWLDGASFLISAWLITGVTIDRETPAARPLASVGPELQAGLRFILGHRVIFLVIAATGVGMFGLRCFGALLALYVRDVLAGGTEIFGALSSLIGIGMVLGNFAVNRASRQASYVSVVLAGLTGIGVAIGVMALLPSLPMAIIGITLMGACFAFLLVPSQTLVQQGTPQAMLGRVMGSMTAILMGAQVIGLTLAAPAGAIVSLRGLYVICAILLISTAAAGHYGRRHLFS